MNFQLRFLRLRYDLYRILYEKYPKSKEIPSPGTYTFLNFYSIKIASRINLNYSNFDGIYCDGFYVVSLFKLFGFSVSGRVSFDFTSIADKVFSYASDRNLNIAIIGSEKKYNDFFCRYLKQHFSGVNIAYHIDGFSVYDDLENSIVEMCSRKPDIIILGLGTELQDPLALKIKSYLDVNSTNPYWIFTCGGFIHQTAINGGIYYPNIVNRLNIRFLYRLFREKDIIKKIFPEVLFVPIYIFFMRLIKVVEHIGNIRYRI
jgi:UDP-N-acetyl-D-mannosaminuronic acid transferase (WecB/TagA/CpsF family)